MSKIDSMVDALREEHGAASDHSEGTLFITEQCICKSNAGYYVGTWCIEAIGRHWLAQPYSRDTGYFLTSALAEVYYENIT